MSDCFPPPLSQSPRGGRRRQLGSRLAGGHSGPGAQIAWISNGPSATFTVRVINEYAYAIAKLSPWD